ncbi:MAG: hypothetical protein GEU86_07615 [Actinophytocola sp.]|nr:hypothetical protein [Actinophytocola sp.]
MPLHRRWSEAELLPEVLHEWRVLLKEQAGMVLWSQLRRLGLSSEDVEANVKAQRWTRVLPRVYATFTGELSRDAKLHAALLYGGGEAVLSHSSAAEEWGMVPITDRPVDITVPYTSSAISQLPLVRVHRSRAIRHSVVATFPPRTKRTDTILDLASAQPTAKEAKYTVVDLLTRHRVDADTMRACFELRPPHRHRGAIKQGIQLVRVGFMSGLEVEYTEGVEGRHGLPVGDRQVPVVVDGKRLWEDCTYDSSGAAVTVRLDGRRDHATAGVAFRDRRRDNAAEIAGRARLVYGWRDVHEDPCAVAAEVRAVLLREGWRPGPDDVVRCEKCS